MRFYKMIKSFFANPEKKFITLKDEFQELRAVLEQVQESDDSCIEIVDFFDSVSKWHDRGVEDFINAFDRVNYGQYDEVLKNLQILQSHFVKAGRTEFGWNRTRHGETVTADKVFLGNIYGLATLPVSSLKGQKDCPKGGWGYPNMEHLNSYDVCNNQAADFIDSHTVPMINSIDNILAVMYLY